MQIGWQDGKGDVFTLFFAIALKRSGGSQGCIESDIACFLTCPAGLNVATAFAVGTRTRASSALLAAQAVDVSFNFSGDEILADLDFIAALPPAGVQ